VRSGVSPTEEPEDAAVLRAFFEGRPDRILAAAGPLQDAQRTVESTVRGPSMGASLPDGARIRIRLRRMATCTPGEVVAFLIGERLVVHRVVSAVAEDRREDFVLTRGDARIVPDPPVPKSSVLGVVEAVERDGLWESPPPRPAWVGPHGAAAELASSALVLLARRTPRLTRAVVCGCYSALDRLRRLSRTRSRS
jgi:hypothetical protein